MIFGDICAPQDRLGKDSIGKDSIVKVSTDKGSIAEVREEKEEEKEEEKNKRNSQSFIHTESASQMSEQVADASSSLKSGLISNVLRNAITLYFMKKYQTMESDGFIQYCISRDWVNDDGESMVENYKKYVDIWMAKK